MDNRFWDPTTSESVTSCSIIMGLGRSEERPIRNDADNHKPPSKSPRNSKMSTPFGHIALRHMRIKSGGDSTRLHLTI